MPGRPSRLLALALAAALLAPAFAPMAGGASASVEVLEYWSGLEAVVRVAPGDLVAAHLYAWRVPAGGCLDAALTGFQAPGEAWIRWEGTPVYSQAGESQAIAGVLDANGNIVDFAVVIADDANRVGSYQERLANGTLWTATIYGDGSSLNATRVEAVIHRNDTVLEATFNLYSTQLSKPGPAAAGNGTLHAGSLAGDSCFHGVYEYLLVEGPGGTVALIDPTFMDDSGYYEPVTGARLTVNLSGGTERVPSENPGMIVLRGAWGGDDVAFTGFDQEGVVELYTLDGQLVASGHYTPGSTLELAGVPPGEYLARFTPFDPAVIRYAYTRAVYVDLQSGAPPQALHSIDLGEPLPIQRVLVNDTEMSYWLHGNVIYVLTNQPFLAELGAEANPGDPGVLTPWDPAASPAFTRGQANYSANETGIYIEDDDEDVAVFWSFGPLNEYTVASLRLLLVNQDDQDSYRYVFAAFADNGTHLLGVGLKEAVDQAEIAAYRKSDGTVTTIASISYLNALNTAYELRVYVGSDGVAVASVNGTTIGAVNVSGYTLGLGYFAKSPGVLEVLHASYNATGYSYRVLDVAESIVTVDGPAESLSPPAVLEVNLSAPGYAVVYLDDVPVGRVADAKRLRVLVTEASEGPHRLRVVLYTAYGVYQGEARFEVNWRPPVLSLSYAGTDPSGAAIIVVDVDDYVVLHGVLNGSVVHVEPGANIVPVPGPGRYTLVVTAVDAAGRTTTRSITFNATGGGVNPMNPEAAAAAMNALARAISGPSLPQAAWAYLNAYARGLLAAAAGLLPILLVWLKTRSVALTGAAATIVALLVDSRIAILVAAVALATAVYRAWRQA